MGDDGDTGLIAAMPHLIQDHQKLLDIIGVNGDLAQTAEKSGGIAIPLWKMAQDNRQQRWVDLSKLGCQP